MILKRSESLHTLTCKSVSRVDRESRDDLNSFSRRCRSDNLQRSGKPNKFSKAMASAVKSRCRHLARRLTSDEFHALVRAVRRQLRPPPADKVTRILRQIVSRLDALEKANPTNFQEFQDSMSLARTQVSLLRRDLLLLSEEKTSLSETCPHVGSRRKFNFQVNGHNPERISKATRSLPAYGESIQVISCESCTQIREDVYFSWFGEEYNTFTSGELSCLETNCRRRLMAHKIRPLSIQGIWMAVLDSRLSRVIL